MREWLRRRRAERNQRRIEALNTQEFLLAKEVAFRRDHGMPVPSYLLPLEQSPTKVKSG